MEEGPSAGTVDRHGWAQEYRDGVGWVEVIKGVDMLESQQG